MRIKAWLVALIGITLSLPSFAQSPVLRVERALYGSINQNRRANGLPPLRWDEALALAARRHAEVMADHGSAQHAFRGEPSLTSRAKHAGSHFGWLAENVIEGPSTEFIQAEFMRSPSHRANILDIDMDSIGIGVVESHGQLFTVEDFSQAR